MFLSLWFHVGFFTRFSHACLGKNLKWIVSSISSNLLLPFTINMIYWIYSLSDKQVNVGVLFVGKIFQDAELKNCGKPYAILRIVMKKGKHRENMWHA